MLPATNIWLQCWCLSTRATERCENGQGNFFSMMSGVFAVPSRPHKIHRRGEKGKGNCFSRPFLPSDMYMEPAQGSAPFFFFHYSLWWTRREAAHRPAFHSMIFLSPFHTNPNFWFVARSYTCTDLQAGNTSTSAGLVQPFQNLQDFRMYYPGFLHCR